MPHGNSLDGLLVHRLN